MYCTTDVTFYCQGDTETAKPKFQAMLNDLAEWMRTNHSDIEAPDIAEPLTGDDLHIGYEADDDPGK